MGTFVAKDFFNNKPGPLAGEGLAQLRSNQEATLEMPFAEAPKDVSILDDNIIPTCAVMHIDTEGNANTDNLRTITRQKEVDNVWHEGGAIYIKAKDPAHKIILVNSQTENGIQTVSGNNEELSDKTYTVLQLRQGSWYQVSTATQADNTTLVTTVTNALTVKDVAINGNPADLASARGQVGDAFSILSATSLDLDTMINAGQFYISAGNVTEKINFPTRSNARALLTVTGNHNYIVNQEYTACLQNATYRWCRVRQSNAWSAWKSADAFIYPGDVRTGLWAKVPGPDYVIANGQAVLFADYPEMKTAWDANLLAKGESGFKLNPDGTGVFVPDLNGLFLQGVTSGAGGKNAAGLPELAGYFGNTVGNSLFWKGPEVQAGGVFEAPAAVTPVISTSSGSPSASSPGSINFRASAGNDTFGKSSTVMPASAKALVCIYVGQPA